jgi:hypothetical protein
LPTPFRVRLGDGSVIDLELPEIKSWYESGLVADDTQVQRPGARDWTRLAQATDVRGWRRPAAPRGVSVPAGRTARPAGGRPPAAARPAASARPSAGDAPSREPLTIDVDLGRWLRLAAVVAVPLLALYLAGPFVLPLLIGTAEQRRVKSAAAADRRYAGVGLTLEAPARWSLLKPDHGLFETPPGTRVTLAQPSANAFATVSSDSPSRAYPSLDAYLDRVFAARRAVEPGLREVRREDSPAGRRLVAARVENRTPVEEITTVWRSGFTYYALTVWAPEAGGRAAAGTDEIKGALQVDTRAAERLAGAVAAVTAEVPLLTRETAERLIGQSEAQFLDPAEAFRRTYALAGAGVASLTPAEQREMGALSSELYARLPAGDRARFGRYLERVRGSRGSDPAEDLAMSRLVKAAFARLPPPRQKRLREVFTRAIDAALAG